VLLSISLLQLGEVGLGENNKVKYSLKNIWGIGNDADNYIDSYNLYAILKLTDSLKKIRWLRVRFKI
jgi:ribosomal protein S13